jgi:hypothetical protein
MSFLASSLCKIETKKDKKKTKNLNKGKMTEKRRKKKKDKEKTTNQKSRDLRDKLIKRVYIHNVSIHLHFFSIAAS